MGAIDGFTDLHDALADQPDRTPDHRVAGQFMQYTSGTTGRPKAVQRELPSFDPETWVSVFSGNLSRYGIEPGGDAVHLVTSPMYHMAPLSFGYFSAHFEHPVVLMDKWDAELALQLIERHRVTDVHMVPTQLHRVMQLPEEVRRRYDVSSLRQVIHAAAPCPIDLKRRLFEWLGPGDLRVLRRHRGRRHPGHSPGLAEPPRHRRPAVAGSGRAGARRERPGRPARHRRHGVPQADGRRLPLQG